MIADQITLGFFLKSRVPGFEPGRGINIVRDGLKGNIWKWIWIPHPAKSAGIRDFRKTEC